MLCSSSLIITVFSYMLDCIISETYDCGDFYQISEGAIALSWSCAYPRNLLVYVVSLGDVPETYLLYVVIFTRYGAVPEIYFLW